MVLKKANAVSGVEKVALAAGGSAPCFQGRQSKDVETPRGGGLTPLAKSAHVTSRGGSLTPLALSSSVGHGGVSQDGTFLSVGKRF